MLVQRIVGGQQQTIHMRDQSAVIHCIQEVLGDPRLHNGVLRAPCPYVKVQDAVRRNNETSRGVAVTYYIPTELGESD